MFELRCAATLTLLSLLEGCNEQARPKLMVQTINFGAVQAILDWIWIAVEVRPLPRTPFPHRTSRPSS